MKPPKILIAVDIEGIAGVWRPEQTQAGQSEYERARRWMTHEANAAIRGAFDGGAGEVLVNDSHGHFGNLLADELDPRAQSIQGKPRLLGMMTGVDQDMDGVLMIGWHSRSKTQGVLAHTTSSFAFARVWLNQDELGEVGIYAALAGEFNVPVLMASGCNVMAEELHALMPHADCAVVKWSDGARSGRSLSPENARSLIATTACRSVQRLTQQQAGLHPAQAPVPLRLPGPLTLRVQCQTPAFADLFALWPTVQRTDADTVQIMCDGIQSAVRSLNALSAMSSALR